MLREPNQFVLALRVCWRSLGPKRAGGPAGRMSRRNQPGTMPMGGKSPEKGGSAKPVDACGCCYVVTQNHHTAMLTYFEDTNSKRHQVTGGIMNVMSKQCRSCIYRPDSPLDLKKLEAEIADPHLVGFFKGHRTCHHSPDGSEVCCRGFWNRHKWKFTAGQIAQRLGFVTFVAADD